MNIDPRQTDPEFQSPLAADSERASQFGMASQANVPQPGGGVQPPTPTAGGGAGPANIVPGAEVVGSDGRRVGTVKEVYDDSFLVEKGFFFVHDFFIPHHYVAQASRERVQLTHTSEEARRQDWTERPRAQMAMRGEAAPPAAVTGVYGPEGPEDTIQAATERGMPEREAQAPTSGAPTTLPESTPTSGVYGETEASDTIQAATNRGLEDTEDASQDDRSGHARPTQRPGEQEADTEGWRHP